MKLAKGCLTSIGAVVVVIIIIAVVASHGSGGGTPKVVASGGHSSHPHKSASLGSPSNPASIGQTIKLSDGDLGDQAEVTLVSVSGDNYTLRIKNVGSSAYEDDIPTDVSVIDSNGQAHQGQISIFGPCANGPFNSDPSIQPGQFMQGCVTVKDPGGSPTKLTFGMFENHGTPGAWKLVTQQHKE